MKKIMLYAYCARNFGDDLMIRILLSRFPQYLFLCDSESCTQQFRQYRNFRSRELYERKFGRLNHLANILTFYRKKDFLLNWLFERIKRQCVCSVYIGGSLYMQKKEADAWVAEMLREEEAKLSQPPLFVIGANFGPVLTPRFQEAFEAYFRRCGGVSFRDQASYARFSELPNTQYAPDVVFNLPEPSGGKCTGRVLISVLDISRRADIRQYEGAYLQFIAEVCRQCITRGKTPVLMSFCKAEGDEAAIGRIRERLGEEENQIAQTYCYDGDMEAALRQIQDADMVIATRFHAMILALRYRKPFFSIVYNEKVRNVLRDLGSGAYCELSELPDRGADGVFGQMNGIRDVSGYMDAAKHQFDQLEGYLCHDCK